MESLQQLLGNQSIYTNYFFALVFLSSVVGSVHCSGMCGPIHLRLAEVKLPVGLYHLGRGVSYSALGAIAGVFGESIFGIIIGSKYKLILKLLLGLSFILLGIAKWFKWSKFSWELLHLGPLLRAKISPHAKAFAMGVLSPMLPCGWLYGNVLAAATLGSLKMGFLYMLLFWFGTLPIFGVLNLFQRKLISLRFDLLAIVYIIFGFLLVIDTSPLALTLNSLLHSSKKIESCPIQTKACLWQDFEIEFSPKPIEAARPFQIHFRDKRLLKSDPIENIEVILRGKSMEMGIQRVQLSPSAMSVYEASTTLPMCTSSKMDWVAEVIVDTEKNRSSIQFEFSTHQND